MDIDLLSFGESVISTATMKTHTAVGVTLCLAELEHQTVQRDHLKGKTTSQN